MKQCERHCIALGQHERYGCGGVNGFPRVMLLEFAHWLDAATFFGGATSDFYRHTAVLCTVCICIGPIVQ